MYVLQLLQLSPEAERRAEQLYDAPRHHGDITYELVHAPDDAVSSTFALLAKELRKVFDPPQLPRFTDADFDRTRRSETPLATALGRGHEVLEILFDPVPMREAIDEIPGDRPVANDVHGLLLLLRLPGMLPAIRRRRGRTEAEWGTILQRERWFRPEGERRLREAAAARGWPPETEPARILAGIVNGAPTTATTDPDDSFGPLAIAAIRRRVEALVTTLRAEADRQIREARQIAPGLRSLTLLHGWIDMYEENAIARGLLKLCGGTMTVAELLRDAGVQRITTPSASDADPEPGEYLTIEAGLPYPRRVGVRKRMCVTFDVTCRCRNLSTPQQILSVVGMPAEGYQHLRRSLLSLRGDDLSPIGDTLAQRLLNTEIASCLRLDGLLRAAIEGNIDLLAQTIVLGGVHRPISAVVPWSNELRDSLNLIPEETQNAKEVIFTDDVRRIVENLHADYSARGYDLIIEIES